MATLYLLYKKNSDKKLFNLKGVEELLQEFIPSVLAKHAREVKCSPNYEAIRKLQENFHDILHRVTRITYEAFKLHGHKTVQFQKDYIDKLGIYDEFRITWYARDRSRVWGDIVAAELAIIVAAAKYNDLRAKQGEETLVTVTKVVALLGVGVPGAVFGGLGLGVANAITQAATEKGMDEVVKTFSSMRSKPEWLAKEDLLIKGFLTHLATRPEQDPDVSKWIFGVLAQFHLYLAMLLESMSSKR